MGRQRQKQHKQGHLQFASTITYILWEGKRRNSISMGICSFQAQSLTGCGKPMTGSWSAKGSALCKHKHLLPVGWQWQDHDQQRGLHFASTSTYSLWEGSGMIRISKGVCTLQTQSLTICGKAMAGSGSPRGSALGKHLQSVERQW